MTSPDSEYEGHVVYMIQDLVVETHDELVLPPSRRRSGFAPVRYCDLQDDKRETYFYDLILLLILVHIFWGISACIIAPGEPRKSQWEHQRAFGAGSKMDCFSSLI